MTKVYVGTYNKYNNGNLFGAWISLDTCKDYNEFLGKCKELHKDEADPEFMIQDIEDFPDGLGCLEWISENDFNDIKNAEKSDFQIINYSEKAIAVIGDTKKIKNELKQLGGRFNFRLSCGAGWIFPKSKLSDIQKLIGIGALETTERTNKFLAWLQEYVSGMNEKDKKYYLKSNVGAIKFDNKYMLIEKQSIENDFCFHDEGPNYEFYISLMEDENKLRDYFINENTKKLKGLLKNMKDGNKLFLSESYDGKELFYNIPMHYWQEDECKGRIATEEERMLFTDAIKFALEQFEKRLKTYLKKYGVSKLNTWTFWADA